VGLSLLLFAIVFVLLFVSFWWRDVIRESLLGYHSSPVKFSLRFGFVLFVVSEIMFFFGIFWTLFYFKLSPEIQVGVVWPPEAIFTLNPLDVPLLNTLILVTSGVAITVVHHDIVRPSSTWSVLSIEEEIALASNQTKFVENYHAWRDIVTDTLNDLIVKPLDMCSSFFLRNITQNRDEVKSKAHFKVFNLFKIKSAAVLIADEESAKIDENSNGKAGYLTLFTFRKFYFFDIYFFFVVTLLLAFAFTALQLQEYWEASFQIRTSVYGGIFYFSTGFHGLHVLLGSVFLFVCFVRLLRFQLRAYPFPFSDGFWMAIWYWHFVDVVWLGLYFFLYLWGEELKFATIFEKYFFVV